MRWMMIRLIAGRELRELVRDRRTLLLIFGLPILLYPVFALVGLVFASSTMQQTTTIGIVGSRFLPPNIDPAESRPAAILGGGPFLAVQLQWSPDWPALLDQGRFLPAYSSSETEINPLRLVELPTEDRGPVDRREVDALLLIPENLLAELNSDHRPTLTIFAREGDEGSKLALQRLQGILGNWKAEVAKVRLRRKGLPLDFADPIEVRDPQTAKPPLQRTTDELRDMLVKLFPFLLVMWTMAGALHPAIDLTAGEKERGTMETLLISPAERWEIVTGKFLATTAYSFTTAVWNLLFMGGFVIVLGYFLPYRMLSIDGLLWSVLLALPLAALFAAVCIGLGVFARSTKEGQYYLLPMFMISMPLSVWSMMPGLKLTWSLACVPITGVMLLQQRLMAVTPDVEPLDYFLPVSASLLVCVALSLWWAARQFQNESVLFREAEQFDLKNWVLNLFRPSIPQVPIAESLGQTKE